MTTKPYQVEICLFPGGKRIAVTTSFDDGHVHDRHLVEAFNEWGLKGTFNLNSGRLGKNGRKAPDGSRECLDQSEVAELFRGHEVAVHTVSHPFLNRLDPSQIISEVMDDRKALEDIVGYPVRGMAYPFGAYDARVIEILRCLGIAYCRTTQKSTSCFPPDDALRWATSGHQYDEGPTIPEQFEKLYEKSSYSGVFFPWGHGFEFHDRNDWSALDRIYKPLSGKPDVWYCTNIELFNYEAARQRMVIAANRSTAYNPSAQTVTLLVDGVMVDALGGQMISLTDASG
jgi:peptidoglycan/xylan/chitin deacetylase (PgdA/CDA1 family)